MQIEGCGQEFHHLEWDLTYTVRSGNVQGVLKTTFYAVLDSIKLPFFSLKVEPITYIYPAVSHFQLCGLSIKMKEDL